MFKIDDEPESPDEGACFVFTIYDEPACFVFAIHDGPESPNKGGMLKIYDEPESPDEGGGGGVSRVYDI